MSGDQRVSVRYSEKFLRNTDKLPRRFVERAKEREKIFREDPFHPLLRTHKLHGKDQDAWAFWATRSYRVKFMFLSDRAVLFLDIGTHDIYE